MNLENEEQNKPKASRGNETINTREINKLGKKHKINETEIQFFEKIKFQIPRGSLLSGWSLCPFDMIPSFFFYFLTFC